MQPLTACLRTASWSSPSAMAKRIIAWRTEPNLGQADFRLNINERYYILILVDIFAGK